MRSIYWRAALLFACTARVRAVQVSAIWAVNTSNALNFNASMFSEAAPPIYAAAGAQEGASNVVHLDWYNNNGGKSDAPATSQADVTAITVGVICGCIALLLCYCWGCRCLSRRRHTPPPAVDFPELRQIKAGITRPACTYTLA